MGPQVSTDLFH